MRINRSIRHAGVVILIGIVGAISVRAERLPRIDLLQEAKVIGSQILLADLLPAGAPAAIRARAAEISLGTAPNPGSLRVLYREAVERSVAESGYAFPELNLPERIVVSRDLRRITQAEVFDTIRKALGKDGVPSPALREEDVRLETEVYVSHPDAGLQVMKMDLDPTLHRARFLLWPASDPKVLPFVVTVQFAGDLTSMSGEPRKQSLPQTNTEARIVQAVSTAHVQNNLVFPGAHATLALHSESLRMVMDVVPLEKGVLGQQIRVRMSDTGKIFVARVDGDAHLVGTF